MATLHDDLLAALDAAEITSATGYTIQGEARGGACERAGVFLEHDIVAGLWAQPFVDLASPAIPFAKIRREIRG